jgi:hypothetical protein
MYMHIIVLEYVKFDLLKQIDPNKSIMQLWYALRCDEFEQENLFVLTYKYK